MEDEKKIDSSDWALVEAVEKNSEKVIRPSLTFWQDAWSRLKRNKVAIISLIVILIIVFTAIVVPFVWRFSYSDQKLEFSNIPPTLKIYDMGDDTYIYVTKDYRAITVSKDGELLGTAEQIKSDSERVNKYNVNNKVLEIDFGTYFEAKKTYMALEKKAKKDPSIDIFEEKRKLDNDIPLYQVIYDGQSIESTKNVRNKTYVLGSDTLGRDLFIRIVYGARISLTIGFVAAFVNFVIGVLYGGISGYIGGRVDSIMMRIVEVISAIPMMLYIILLIVVMEPGLKTIIIALSITYWVGMARIVRGQVLSMRDQEFVCAAKTLGASTGRILTKHLIPNIMGPIMVSLTMQIPSAMFSEAFLSFVGLGVSAPVSSWGKLCNDALAGMYTYPYQLFFPALTISITILSFNLFGDGLRDALDPKQRK